MALGARGLVLVPRRIPPVTPEVAPTLYLEAAVAEAERQVIERVLQHAQGNHNPAEELIGQSRTRFYRKPKEDGLSQGREHEIFDEIG